MPDHPLRPPVGYEIERGLAGDVTKVPLIERAAAKLFVERGLMTEEQAEETTSLEAVRVAQSEGRLWVAREESGAAVGFAITGDVGGALHIHELDVHPAHGRRGLGAALVEAVCESARASGYARATLTTDRWVPWNAPFYARLGFNEIPATGCPDALKFILRDEEKMGLDPARRLAMERPLGRG